MLYHSVEIVNDLENLLHDLLWVFPKPQFSQTVSVDLNYLEPNTWYLHMIDEFSRSSNAVIIRKKDDSINMFMKHWISIFGAPNYIFSDKRGEFIGDDFYDMCGKFNIKVLGTASFSPWSNGTCERHNNLITTMLFKIHDDVKCSYDTTLACSDVNNEILVDQT